MKADHGQKKSVMSKRRKFNDELTREAVALTRLPGAQLSQVIRDIGMGAGVLGVDGVNCRPARRRLSRAGRATRPGDSDPQARTTA
jgi:transposase